MLNRIEKAIRKIDEIKCFTNDPSIKKAARHDLHALQDERKKHYSIIIDGPELPAAETNPALMGLIEKIENL